ncbi:hypothetical protein ACTXT7_012929 [Hymenolepis weldensis]
MSRKRGLRKCQRKTTWEVELRPYMPVCRVFFVYSIALNFKLTSYVFPKLFSNRIHYDNTLVVVPEVAVMSLCPYDSNPTCHV